MRSFGCVYDVGRTYAYRVMKDGCWSMGKVIVLMDDGMGRGIRANTDFADGNGGEGDRRRRLFEFLMVVWRAVAQRFAETDEWCSHVK